MHLSSLLGLFFREQGSAQLGAQSSTRKSTSVQAHPFQTLGLAWCLPFSQGVGMIWFQELLCELLAGAW